MAFWAGESGSGEEPNWGTHNKGCTVGREFKSSDNTKSQTTL